jgi:glycosyltransferase involved in cell wall biosynthesis
MLGSVNMKYVYLGAFPPPYGGVTIKNKLLFTKISEHIEVKESTFNKTNSNIFAKICSLTALLFSNRNSLIIGISKNSLKIITHLLYIINKRLMNRSIVMVMGGEFSDVVAADIKLQKRVIEYKHIYVETESMKKVLVSVGVVNVSVFPNCREKPDREIQKEKNNTILKCLFFSLISKDKGVDNILEASRLLDKKGITYSIDFYGHIDKELKQTFQNFIESNENLNYSGVLKSTDKNELYEKLNSYDVLLFPTKWKNEGVPGVLVESKIACLPAIVSNINYNSEIVENGKTGIVLNDNSPIELANAIEKLYLNRDLLIEMGHNVKNSSEKYLIENYIIDIVNEIKRN